MDPDEVKKILGYGALSDSNLDKNPDAAFDKVALRVAGFGGQGIMSTGIALANVGMEYGYNVSWLPSYGPEMRGGTANCSVKIQGDTIGASECTEPNMIITMNQPSLEKFEKILVPDGVIIYNSTLIDIEPTRKDVKVYAVPITGIADELGNTRFQSMVNVGAFAAITGMFEPGEIRDMMSSLFAGKSEKVIKLNEEAVQRGYNYVKDNYS
jgi:Pyruvate/2-oxoacid:ferredoxin oxidoreductase gamma subunit